MTVSMLVFLASFAVGGALGIAAVWGGFAIAVRFGSGDAPRRRNEKRRWACESCGHGVSSHMSRHGQFTGCRNGFTGIMGVASGGCECDVYIGKRPPARLIHPVPEPGEAAPDTEPANA